MGGGVNWPPTWRNNWQPPLPKTFLTGFCCKRFLEYFAVLKTKWLCISILKLYWIILSPVRNKINISLGMEATLKDFVTTEETCRRIRLVMNMIGLLVLDNTFKNKYCGHG